MGHFEKTCRGEATQISGALLMAATGGTPSPTVLPMPTLEVKIRHKRLKQSILVTVVADTGTQTSCAGPDLLHMLNLKHRDLSRSVQLRDFANRKVDSLGEYWSKI